MNGDTLFGERGHNAFNLSLNGLPLGHATKKFFKSHHNSIVPIFQVRKPRHWETAEPGFKTRDFYSKAHILYYFP